MTSEITADTSYPLASRHPGAGSSGSRRKEDENGLSGPAGGAFSNPFDDPEEGEGEEPDAPSDSTVSDLPFATADEEKRGHRIWNAYLYGQLANVAKQAVWWSMFMMVVQTMLEDEDGLWWSRVAFNLALIFLSPLAGAFAQRASIRLMLNVTTIGRLVIWSILVPLSWWGLKWGLRDQIGNPTVFAALFITLMFLDGTQVAFANVVDIDCGGLDTLSLQYRLPVTDAERNRFNSIHQMVFDLSFVFFTPLVAVGIWQASAAIARDKKETAEGQATSGEFALVFGVSSVFFLLSAISLAYYLFGLPKQGSVLVEAEPEMLAEYGADQELGEAAGEGGMGAGTPNSTSSARGGRRQSSAAAIGNSFAEKARDVWDGLCIVLRERALKWRLVFLALETALEDAMVSVVVPEIALHTPALFADSSDTAKANLASVCVIAVGKLGGFLAGWYMNRAWEPPTEHHRRTGYRYLFWSVLVSSLSVCLLPAGIQVLEAEHGEGGSSTGWSAAQAGCLALLLLGVLFFFVFSTAPKIGFATLLQGLVADQQAVGKVFGFVGTFVTFMDAVVIVGVNSVFTIKEWKGSHMVEKLWIAAAVYVAHGVLEVVLGPLLILDPPPREVDDALIPDKGRERRPTEIQQETPGHPSGEREH
uniref:Uncharacterized protein n=1 Tax=Chromera velia CCMP2878 TaxID=1169474 RepID=A0A0G4HLV8_9ALVE|eukprot:Cvel_28955.t1-p1 / transcript=Cvel_28955.t1 / gene=Cvel_28955 / organism=Chromera_velia_CCMP2878 / gene_product=hypothetical protein / transcript_product=hypothetical protein / location=Cvel_scaffold3885:5731-10848(-) / protein_length=645 / sequence_SO=supercontig / SO=protein_coding / is_pseudo=false